MRQVLRTGVLGRPRGMGWGGRWEGRSGWGIHVNPWQKSLQYCKVISLQLIIINGKKKLLKKKILEWAARPSSRGSFGPGLEPVSLYILCIGRQVLYH